MNFSMILSIAAIFAAYLVLKQSTGKLVQRIGRERKIPQARILYVRKSLDFSWSILVFVAIGLVAYKDFGIFFSSVFAVIGVALFAQWSILSNITSSIIIFFFFPYRVGDVVKIIDGDNFLEGSIHEITLFHVILLTESGSKITYPNSLIFQRPVEITTKDKRYKKPKPEDSVETGYE